MNLSTTSACVGGRYAPAATPTPKPRSRPREVLPDGFDLLTPSERKAIEAVSRSGLSKIAAFELGVSIKTIEAHMYSARNKTGYSTSIPMLIEYAKRKGFQ